MRFSWLFVFIATASLTAADITYPVDAGVIDVRTLGAVGDGMADDTAALQRALSQGVDHHQIVYLPSGIYRVSDTLRWKHDHEDGPSHGWGRFMELRGAGIGRTVIRVADATAGFTDPAVPKAVVQTGSSGSDGDKKYWNGEGNEAFGNHLRDFTLEIGAGNPGAIGISYQASNTGAMRQVLLRAAAGSGLTGIDLTRRDNGPGLLTGVTIEGFSVGIRSRQEICQFTADNLTLKNQREVGVLVHDAVFALRAVTSINRVPALRIEGVGLCDLLDSDLDGQPAEVAENCAKDAATAAIVITGNQARCLLRGVTVRGYTQGIDCRGTAVAGGRLEWWASDALLGGANPPSRIAVQDTPQPVLPPASEWTLVAAPSGGDDASALEAAFAAHTAVVCLRRAHYRFARGVTVPAHVRWLIGLGTTLNPADGMPTDGALLRFAGGTDADVTVVDAFGMGLGNRLFALHEDSRTLVLRDLLPFDTRMVENRPGAGRLFIEDCAGAGYRFARGTQVFIRQWNAEGPGDPKAVVDGAQVWALGAKHESAETALSATGGSVVEIYGALHYTFGSDLRPAYSLTDTRAVLSFAGTTYRPNGFFKTLVRALRDGKPTDLSAADAPSRGGGRMVTAYIAP